MDDKENNVRHEAAALQPHKKPTPAAPLEKSAWADHVDAQLLARGHLARGLHPQTQRHAAELPTRRSIFGNMVGRAKNVWGVRQMSQLRWVGGQLGCSGACEVRGEARGGAPPAPAPAG